MVIPANEPAPAPWTGGENSGKWWENDGIFKVNILWISYWKNLEKIGHKSENYDTLWWTNIAMENHHF